MIPPLILLQLALVVVLAGLLAKLMWPRLSRRRRWYLLAAYAGILGFLFRGIEGGVVVWLLGSLAAWYFIEEPATAPRVAADKPPPPPPGGP
jgi:hypothetical protein